MTSTVAGPGIEAVFVQWLGDPVDDAEIAVLLQVTGLDELAHGAHVRVLAEPGLDGDGVAAAIAADEAAGRLRPGAVARTRHVPVLDPVAPRILVLVSTTAS